VDEISVAQVSDPRVQVEDPSHTTAGPACTAVGPTSSDGATATPRSQQRTVAAHSKRGRR
jgi:hypothetical protein